MLLADSLILDLAAEAKWREGRLALATELEELVTALGAFGRTASDQMAATTAAIAGNDVATMRSLAREPLAECPSITVAVFFRGPRSLSVSIRSWKEPQRVCQRLSIAQ